MGEVGGRWAVGGGSLQREALFPEPRAAGAKAAGCRRGAGAGVRSGQACTCSPAAAGSAADVRAVPLRPRERESLPHSWSPKQNNTAFQHPKSSTSTPPQTILLIGSSAPGMMRAAAGGPAVPSRSRPARAGEGVGCPACSRGSRAAKRGARGRVRSGRGRPGAPRWPSPLLRLERFQSRGAAPLSSALAQRSSC